LGISDREASWPVPYQSAQGSCCRSCHSRCCRGFAVIRRAVSWASSGTLTQTSPTYTKRSQPAPAKSAALRVVGVDTLRRHRADRAGNLEIPIDGIARGLARCRTDWRGGDVVGLRPGEGRRSLVPVLGTSTATYADYLTQTSFGAWAAVLGLATLVLSRLLSSPPELVSKGDRDRPSVP
jgi:hypothetical protein